MRPFVGRWRIVGADCYDRDHLDLCGEAHLVVPPEGWGEISFGAFTASVNAGAKFHQLAGVKVHHFGVAEGCPWGPA